MYFQGGFTGSAWEFNALHERASENIWGRDEHAAAHRLLGPARVCEERQQRDCLAEPSCLIKHGRFSLHACTGSFMRE